DLQTPAHKSLRAIQFAASHLLKIIGIHQQCAISSFFDTGPAIFALQHELIFCSFISIQLKFIHRFNTFSKARISLKRLMNLFENTVYICHYESSSFEK